MKLFSGFPALVVSYGIVQFGLRSEQFNDILTYDELVGVVHFVLTLKFFATKKFSCRL